MTEPPTDQTETEASPADLFAATLTAAVAGSAARRSVLDHLFAPSDEQPPPTEPTTYAADLFALEIFRRTPTIEGETS